MKKIKEEMAKCQCICANCTKFIIMKNEKTLNDKTYLNCYKKNIITFDSLPEYLKK